MTQQEKERVAVFRFGVIFPLLDDTHRGWGDQKRILDTLTKKRWEIPGTHRTYLSRATILNWYKHYKERGERIESLYPADRSDCGRRRSFSDEVAAALLQLRNDHPKLTIAKLMEIARSQQIIGSVDTIKTSTVYRFFAEHKKHELHTQEDLRKFEVELANDLWQSDCLHGPVVLHEGKRVKSYLFAIIDDKSRLVTGSKFYLQETTEAFLDCLWTALRTRGLPRILYTDNGSSFRSHRLQIGCASLQISLRYAKPYRPVGKGKIERFNRTVRMQFFPELPDDLSLEDLNNRWSSYVENTYHQRRHSSTGETPLKRFLDDVHLLRGAPQRLPDHFRVQVERTVGNDRTVRLENHLFEAPVGLAGKRVTLRYENLDRIELYYQKKSYGFIYEVNMATNSRTGRKEPKVALPVVQNGSLFSGGNL